MAWLLGTSPSLRFTKLDRRSPAIAIVPTRTPIFHEAEQNRGARGGKHCKDEAADGLGWTKPGAAVAKRRPAVERRGEFVAKEQLGDHRRSIGYCEQDQELENQSFVHGAPQITRDLYRPSLVTAPWDNGGRRRYATDYSRTVERPMRKMPLLGAA